MDHLSALCRDTQRLTAPNMYRKLALRPESDQIIRAVGIIRTLLTIREQFRDIFMLIDAASERELLSMEEEHERDEDFVRMYLKILDQERYTDTSSAMFAVAKVYATTNGRMSDCLVQLEHPLLHEPPIKSILERPQGEIASFDEAYGRFLRLTERS